jgi:hypothetical protein
MLLSFLSATPSRIFFNVYNTLYHKGILKMEQKLGKCVYLGPQAQQGGDGPSLATRMKGS